MSHIESLCAPGLFGERFEVIKCLGQGARGTVLLAKDTTLFNSLVALKTSPLDSVYHDKQWLYREVLVNRQVTSQFVVRIFEVGTRIDLLPFYVMEYMAGGSLKEKLQEEVLPLHKAMALILQILEGAAIIHESGILHNDIKTSNILVGDDNLPKLADFGSQQVADVKKSNQIYGSAHYLAPEGWQGKEGSVHGDIYALGIVMYEVLTGILPFDGATQAELMYKHLEQEPVHPTDLCDSVPEWLGEYVLKMIAKDPYERFPSIRSCQEFLINGMTNPLHTFVDQSILADKKKNSPDEPPEEDGTLSYLLRPVDLNKIAEAASQPADAFPQDLIPQDRSYHGELRERISESFSRKLAGFFCVKLSRAERSVLAIYLAAITSWFFISPIISLTRSFIEVSNTSESWLLFTLAFITPVLLVGHLTALPLTTLVWMRVNLKAACRVWIRVTATCAASFICFFGLFLYQLHVANDSTSRLHFEMGQLHSSLKCALQNLVQVVLLFPESTLYRADKGVLVPLLSIDTGNSGWDQRLPYYLVMTFCVFCISYLSRRHLWQFVPNWSLLMDLAVTAFVLLLSVTSFHAVPFIEEHLTKMRYVIDLNDVVLTFPIPQLVWVLITWFLVLLVQAVVRWISDVRVRE
jgi:serine/threonine protein kinase